MDVGKTCLTARCKRAANILVVLSANYRFMLRIILPFVFLCCLQTAFGQELTQVQFSGGAGFSSFAFTTDQQIIIKVSDDGKILEWGNALEAGRYYNMPGKLQPYMGRVDYYGNEADSVSKGKVKSIGTCMISYYGPSDMPEKVGKIRSLGRITLDYYSNFENAAYRGKLKSAGYAQLAYYGSFENEVIRGKLKSVNTTSLTWYNSFDDKIIQGKIKSIGSYNYTWYSSFDGRNYQGGLKSGALAQNINGVVYIIQ